ncbi:MAG: choice-of-anchor B family protein [Flavobacteriales bacterium]
MKSLLALGIGLLLTMHAHAQTNISLLGHLDYQALRSTNLSNLWGYTDEEGNEYALVGVNGLGTPNSGGLSVVNVTDPANPVEVFFAPGPPSAWREIKVWGDHAYVTTEANFGLQIVDLSPLPQSTELPVTVFQGQGWNTAHSLFIDENGRLYLHGSNRGNGGVIMYDLTQNPEAPMEVGTYDPMYCHDSFARGDTLYAAHIYAGTFTIVDVSDPAAPVMLGSSPTPSLFTHNMWLDDTGDHLFTSDEVANAFVGSYNVSDPSDVVELDRIRSDPGFSVIPHNVYWLDHYLVVSYYTYGVVIYDATHPDNLVEVGHYDTSPYTGYGFHGAWGVYPFFPSGNLVISDIEGGLYVLAPTYERATWLKGLVTDAITGAPVNQALVTLVSSTAKDSTSFNGRYALGTADAGTYTVTVSAAGYPTATITGVELVQGVVTVLDIPLGATTGLEELAAEAALSVAPNPCHGQVTLERRSSGSVQVELLDLLGREVMPSFRMQGSQVLRVHDLLPGLYLVRSTDPLGAIAVQRLTVE